MSNNYFNRILYGGDYNPEQWPNDIWTEDMKLLKDAKINTATINVFSWAKLQPSENIYDFKELDKIINMLSDNGYDIVLATSTAALPAWMYKKYPEVGRVDFEGRRHKFGQRHNACPNSPIYQKYSSILAGKLAERYSKNVNIKLWHINNEYGGECFCENCEKAFRVWLRDRYKNIKELNRAWNTAFWGHTIYQWDEIVVPNILSESIDYENTAFAGMSIDYRRFNSESILNNFINEKEQIRKFDKDTPITTNMMGTYKYLDYFSWAKEIDIISWDNYPSYDTKNSFTAMNHDLMRGLKDGKPFMLMEQTPSQQNWQPYNSLKEPGKMRIQSYQALAHGSDTVQFFQLRRSIGGCEKFHGGVIEHSGSKNTRVFREVSKLGRELESIGDEFLSAVFNSKVGIVFDWENYWAVEYTSGPSKDLKYLDQIHNYYQYFYDNNIPVDMISVDSDFEKYDLIIAPLLYMMKDKLDEKISSFIKKGGNFITTFMSGIVNLNDNVFPHGYPGPLREILGIWVEEIDALAPEQKNKIVFSDGKEATCNLLCDIIHLEGAKSLANYDSNFYKGSPVITENQYGDGLTFYVGSQIEKDGLYKLLDYIIEKLHIESIEKDTNLEITRRVNKNGVFNFILNQTQEACSVPEKFVGKLDIISKEIVYKGMKLDKYDVLIVKER